jgi:pSer/pThr/pTyr-binding forkhead associated (FHA) protein
MARPAAASVPTPASVAAVPLPAPIAAPPAVSAPPGATPAASGGTVSCPSCGAPVPAGFKFCGGCGAKISAPAVATPAAAAPAAAAAMAGARGKLVLIRPDGSEGGSHPVRDGVNVIGRESGSLFGGDSYLSPKHVTLTVKGSSIHVRDEASLNGVYLKIPRETPVEIKHGDVFRIGQEIVVYEAIEQPGAARDGVEPVGSPIEGYWGRVSLVVGRDSTANAFPVGGDGCTFGRERGDLLFPEDGYVSGLHCRITTEGGRVFLTDLGSSNGTFLRLKTDRTVQNGDFLLLGQQLFKVVL